MIAKEVEIYNKWFRDDNYTQANILNAIKDALDEITPVPDKQIRIKMATKTAVRELIEELNIKNMLVIDGGVDEKQLIELIDKSLEKEKQQIIDAFAEGHARFTECEESELEAKVETYYNQTFKQ